MREILFRGKTYSGEWVQGTYYHQKEFYGDKTDIHYIIESCDQLEDNMMVFSGVIPSTVGQYTGLTDKYGKKIFVGDIVKYKQTDAAKRNNKTIICIGKVIYNTKTASFAVESKDKEGIKYFDYFPIKSCENIGNIHDNPELLKGAEQ